jgi:hypothetical protein
MRYSVESRRLDVICGWPCLRRGNRQSVAVCRFLLQAGRYLLSQFKRDGKGYGLDLLNGKFLVGRRVLRLGGPRVDLAREQCIHWLTRHGKEQQMLAMASSGQAEDGAVSGTRMEEFGRLTIAIVDR